MPVQERSAFASRPLRGWTPATLDRRSSGVKDLPRRKWQKRRHLASSLEKVYSGVRQTFSLSYG